MISSAVELIEESVCENDSCDSDDDMVEDVSCLSNTRGVGVVSCKSANGSFPDFRISLARRKGTSSPAALPVPLQNPGIATDHRRAARDGASFEWLCNFDQASDSLHTWGNKKRAPVCRPLPSPIVDKTPQPVQNRVSNKAFSSHTHALCIEVESSVLKTPRFPCWCNAIATDSNNATADVFRVDHGHREGSDERTAIPKYCSV